MPALAPVDVDGYVVRAGFLGDTAFFVSGEGTLVLGAEGHREVRPHKSGVLAAEASRDGKSLLTSGDDGCIYQTRADSEPELLSERPRKWIDLIAAGPSGAVAFACGRTAWVRFADGKEREFTHDRAVGGLAFAPKGMRLAVARYDGVTLWWAGSEEAKPSELSWKGAHLATSFSPDGKYLVTAMQENALHGWRLSDSQNMRMSGYPAKSKSFSWSVKGRYLATSGANAAILWPYFGKNGPMGQAPLQLCTREDAQVTTVACHPSEEVVAIGYHDGMVIMGRFSDNAAVVLREPAGGAVTTLGWHENGNLVAVGTENGEAGVLDLRE